MFAGEDSFVDAGDHFPRIFSWSMESVGLRRIVTWSLERSPEKNIFSVRLKALTCEWYFHGHWTVLS